MQLRLVRLAAIVVLTGLAAAPARAQLLPATPDATGSRVRLGPLWMNPSISLTNVGVDTNLFNDAGVLTEAGGNQPTRDIAVSVTPQTDLWMRAGRTWFAGNARQDVIWYKDYRDEGSTNGAYKFGWVVPLTRVSLLVDAQWVHAKERPGLEIDTRALRREGGVSTAAELRVLSRTYFGGSVERRDIRFAEGSLFEGEDLRQELNRHRTTAAGFVRHALTPMTSLVTEVSRYRDAFAFSPDRDAESTQVRGGVKFDPTALIKGSAFVGYRRYTPSSADVPGYAGPTVMVAVSYAALSSTRVAVDGSRDIEYSFDRDQPFYVQSGAGGSVTQRVFGPMDVEGRFSHRTLAYQDRQGAGVLVADRRDRVRTVGGGVGYRLGRDLRLAVNVEQQRRSSALRQRNYQGYRYGMSLTYGL